MEFAWLKNYNDDYIQSDGSAKNSVDSEKPIILKLDSKDGAFIPSKNAIDTGLLIKGNAYRLTYAEKLGDGFTEGLVHFNVIFDGEKFVEDENNIASNCIVFSDDF